MKKRLSWLPVVALIFGVSSAFTSKIINTENKGKADSYYWFNTSSTYQDLKTIAGEKSRTGCTGSLLTCENGYTQDQLVNPADPSQGVKTGQMPAVQIFHA